MITRRQRLGDFLCEFNEAIDNANLVVCKLEELKKQVIQELNDNHIATIENTLSLNDQGYAVYHELASEWPSYDTLSTEGVWDAYECDDDEDIWDGNSNDMRIVGEVKWDDLLKLQTTPATVVHSDFLLPGTIHRLDWCEDSLCIDGFDGGCIASIVYVQLTDDMRLRIASKLATGCVQWHEFDVSRKARVDDIWIGDWCDLLTSNDVYEVVS